jgi:hypothetical protein
MIDVCLDVAALSPQSDVADQNDPERNDDCLSHCAPLTVTSLNESLPTEMKAKVSGAIPVACDSAETILSLQRRLDRVAFLRDR